MLAKMWKKILLFILIIACLFTVTKKLVTKISLGDELKSVSEYIKQKDN